MTSEESRRVAIQSLGPATVCTPLASNGRREGSAQFVDDQACVRFEVELSSESAVGDDPLFEKAGPRKELFFDPGDSTVAIVTCGGLCPGLNNVIRSVVLELHHRYGVRKVLGIPYGYKGFNPAHGLELVQLTAHSVQGIDKAGGTVLGTSRGDEDAAVVVDTLQREGVSILLCVGGDGTQRGAHGLYEEVSRRGAKIAVVGIPKTIDNDLQYCFMTFGYATAVDAAQKVIGFAHNEASSADNGIGLVKVMGRDAGFIAAAATVASQEVNFTLIPEVPFALDGERGLLAALKQRLLDRRHAVIVVAEGAGQNLFEAGSGATDASGNIRYIDIGLYMRDKIKEHFAGESMPVDLKYIDPSYIIRSTPANFYDSVLCDQFARNAVHAGMAGKTDLIIGHWNNVFIHVPISMATAGKRQLDPESNLWRSVLATTGQAKRYG